MAFLFPFSPRFPHFFLFVSLPLFILKKIVALCLQILKDLIGVDRQSLPNPTLLFQCLRRSVEDCPLNRVILAKNLNAYLDWVCQHAILACWWGVDSIHKSDPSLNSLLRTFIEFLSWCWLVILHEYTIKLSSFFFFRLLLSFDFADIGW